MVARGNEDCSSWSEGWRDVKVASMVGGSMDMEVL